MSDDAQHRVSWSDDGDVTFYCDGDETSPCHQWPDCDHGEWPCGHEPASHAECSAVLSLQGTGDVAWYDGGALLRSVPIVDGPIEVEWDGDGWLWCYVESDALAEVSS